MGVNDGRVDQHLLYIAEFGIGCHGFEELSQSSGIELATKAMIDRIPVSKFAGYIPLGHTRAS